MLHTCPSLSRFLFLSFPSYYIFIGMCNPSVYIDSPGIKLDTLINYLIVARASRIVTIPITQLIWKMMYFIPEAKPCSASEYITWRSFGKDGRSYGISVRTNSADKRIE